DRLGQRDAGRDVDEPSGLQLGLSVQDGEEIVGRDQTAEPALDELTVVLERLANRRRDYTVWQLGRNINIEQRLTGGSDAGRLGGIEAVQVEPGKIGELPARAALECRKFKRRCGT